MTNLTTFAMNIPNSGSRNQLLGAVAALSGNSSDTENRKCFLLPYGIEPLENLHDTFGYHLFKSYKQFRDTVFTMIETYFNKIDYVPQVFVTVYDPTDCINPTTNVDMLCRAVKEYYEQHHLGKVFTIVLTSKLHNYRYVDLINVPKHLLTFYSRLKLLKNKKLRRKVFLTIGILHNLSKELLHDKQQALEALLQKQYDNAVVSQQIAKIQKHTTHNKKIVFCLGGRTASKEIVFENDFNEKLWKSCQSLLRNDYSIVIVNGNRTPNKVSDFFFEKSLNTPNLVFQNSKPIAQNDKERQNWRIYSGKYEKEFSALQQIGNIYQAMLNYPNTIVVHTIDSYSCCETTSLGIPTAICNSGIYINTTLRPDCINMYRLMVPFYAINLEEFVKFTTFMKIEPKHLQAMPLSMPLQVFAQTVQRKFAKEIKTK